MNVLSLAPGSLSWRGFLHKAELIADAEPLSEKSSLL